MMGVPKLFSDRAVGEARALVVVALALVTGAAFFAGFRAEDWLNLEVGWRGLLVPPRVIWRSLDALSLYRPLTVHYHGAMYRAFGIDPTPHLLAMVAMLALQTLLWARVAVLRRGAAHVGWLVAAAVLAQCHAYLGEVLWVSTSARSLATTLMLVAIWLHHRAVAAPTASAAARAIRLVPIGLAAALAPFAKEDGVIVPLLVGALEAARWRSLGPAARREALASLGVITAACAFYLAVRIPSPPSPPESTYHMRLGLTSLVQLAKFLVVLGGPALATAALVWFLARGRVPGPTGDDDARREVIAGLAWTAAATAPYLLLGGFSYGYLYLPLWGSSLALASGLQAVSERAGSGWRGALPARALGGLWLLTAAGSAAVMIAFGVPRYRALASDAYEVLDRTLPHPPPNATLLFLDPDPPEVPAGRSLFNMVFDNVPMSMARLHYRRLDLRGSMLRGRAAFEALASPPRADAVYLARAGRLVPIHGERGDRAHRTTPGVQHASRSEDRTDPPSALPLRSGR